MSNLYIFTLRDVRVDGVPKYPGLIPKLFSIMYGDPSITLSKVFDYDKMIEKYSQKEIFKLLLKQKSVNVSHIIDQNLLQASRYLSQDDKDKLIDINLEYFDKETFTREEYINLIEHLFMGHPTMEYGIYFGSRKADNDKDFLDSINRTVMHMKNQTLICYTKLETLLDFIDTEKKNYEGPILHFNTGWQYGEYGGGTKVYSRENRGCDFISHINSFDNIDLETSEIICRFPLPIELFNHTFKSTHETTFKGGKSKKNKSKKRKATRRSNRRSNRKGRKIN